MSDRHEFEMTYPPGDHWTEEAAKSLIGRTVPVQDEMTEGGFSVGTAVPYEVIDARIDEGGSLIARLRAVWADDDPRMKALQRVRRFMASGEFALSFEKAFNENLPNFIKRDDEAVQEMADPRPEPLQVEDEDDLPPDLLAGR